MTAKVFIDGEVGTTGLEIRDRLRGRADVELLTIPEALRKDPEARKSRLNAADLVILCLPDEAAREAVALISNPSTRVIDASTAHRTARGWTYGFPEMAPDQRGRIRDAARVANGGCYAMAAISLLRPLVDQGLVPADAAISINAVSGYSGGGRGMIEEFEREGEAATPFRLYALGLGHKHLPEIMANTGLTHPPLFAPAVGRYFKGMIVEAPLSLWALPQRPALSEVHAALAARYANEPFVRVAGLDEAAGLKTLAPEALNGTNMLEIFVFGDAAAGQARLAARLDNLGKGAAGAAVQNLNIMLGLPESAGLTRA